MSKLRVLLETLRSSMWFVPALIVVGAVGLAVGLIEMDWLSRQELVTRWPRIFGAGADGSRALLSAIASSMITVAGVTFSITVVALALASSQYTSRILRNFMSDRANQAVLGVFLGVFAYCLVVLRTIRGGAEGLFVPSLAVLGAVLLSFVAIAFLIFFIHHIAASIQATSIIAAAAGETLRAVDRLFPAQMSDASVEQTEGAKAQAVQVWVMVPARTTGYIQGVDGNALFDAQEQRLAGDVHAPERDDALESVRFDFEQGGPRSRRGGGIAVGLAVEGDDEAPAGSADHGAGFGHVEERQDGVSS